MRIRAKTPALAPAKPVWTPGPPPKPGLYQISCCSACGWTVIVVHNVDGWSHIVKHKFLMDLPPCPKDAVPPAPVPRGKNPHFVKYSTSDAWFAAIPGCVTQNLGKPINDGLRPTIARLALGYGWTGDGWEQWANLEGGAK